MSKIFVAIAAFNELYLKQTIESLINNKSSDNEIMINLCDFRTKNNFESFDYKEVSHHKFISSIPTGVGLARSMAAKGFEKFDYMLQIDAHMTFGKNWDSELIKRHLLLEQKEGESVISQHLPALVGNNDRTMSNYPPDRKQINEPVRLFINEKMQVWSTPWEATENVWYIENSAVSAAFMFCRSETFAKIPPDPLIFFFGEEHSLYMRMYSRGIKSFSTDYYDIKHLDKNIVFFEDLEKEDWRTFSFSNADPNVILFQIFSAKRVGAILRGEILGIWGAQDPESCIKAREKMNISKSIIDNAFGTLDYI